MLATERTGSTPRVALPVVRVAGGSSLTVAWLGVGPMFAGVHWLGRALMCTGENCEACAVQSPRLMAYLPVAFLPDGGAARTALWEITDAAWQQAAGLARMEGITLELGSLLMGERKRERSPLRVTPLGTVAKRQLPMATRWGLTSAVATLFRLPAPTANEETAAWAARAKPAAVRLLADALNAV